MEMYQEEIKDFDKAIELFPKSDFAYNNVINYLNSENKITQDIYGPHNYILGTYLDSIEKRLSDTWIYQTSEEIITMPRTSIIVKDQFPISTNNDIKVKNGEFGTAKWDEKTGILVWNLNLSLGGSQNLQFDYSVDYQKGYTLYLE